MTLQPNDVKAEEAVIAAITLRGHEALIDIVDIVSDPAMFYDRRNVAVWTAVLSLANRKEPLELAAIDMELDRMGLLAQAGGAGSLTRYNNAPSTSTRKYAEKVRDLADRRRLIRKLREISERVAGAKTLTESIQSARMACTMADARVSRQYRHIGEIAAEFEDSMRTMDESAPPRVVTTGHKSCDELSGGGLSDGDLLVLAASSGAGKTGWMLGMARANTMYEVSHERWAPLNNSTHVLIISLEMASARLLARTIGAMAKVSPLHFRREGRTWLTQTPEGKRVAHALEDVRTPQIYLTDPQEVHDFDDVRSASGRWASEMRARFGDKVQLLVMVDYLGLMGPSKHWSRSLPSHEVKAMKAEKLKMEVAQALALPVVALAQLNDGPEDRAQNGKDPRPVLRDLAGARMIRAHCDYLGFLYRPWKYAPHAIELNQNYTHLAREAANNNLDQAQVERFEELKTMREHAEFWYYKARAGIEMIPRWLRFLPELTTYCEPYGGYQPPEPKIKKWV